MKILFVSNFYPPNNIGGYELLCHEVSESLKERGYTITILTSTFGLNSEAVDGHVHRLLALESNLDYYQIRDAWSYPAKRRKNIDQFRKLLAIEKPDMVFIWGMWSLSKQIAEEAEKLMGSRVVYYLANPWPIQPNMHVAYWDSPANKTTGKLVKPFLRIPARIVLHQEWRSSNLRFEHAPCCSKALRDQLLAANVPLQDAPVIYEGINLQSYFRYHKDRTNSNIPLLLLYVGILAPHKGVHTAIEAIARLTSSIKSQVKLTILGTGHPKYEERLHALVTENNLADRIAFKTPIPRSDLPEFLGQHDILLLPSIWEEPLALIMQEGLASGLVVVGSTTGGTKEIIVDGENGILFPPENASALAEGIENLVNDPALQVKLAENGQKTAKDKFDIRRMVDDIEAYLTAIANATPISQ
jgi:glycogen(starch) synthase